jgi:hypothetical protein
MALYFKNAVMMKAIHKIWPTAACTSVYKDNGIDIYSMKEETRVEGPWEYG